MSARKALCLIIFPLILAACGSSPSWDGYSPAEANKLQAMGISAEDAAHYRGMGFTSGTIQRWHDEGITIPHNVTAWHDAHFTAEEAGAWHRGGFSLKDAYDWRKKKFSADDAKKWRDQGVSMRDAEKKRKKGLTPD